MSGAVLFVYCASKFEPGNGCIFLRCAEGGKTTSEYIYSKSELADIVLPLLKKYGAEKAILFGSYARQEADSSSDIDLMIIGGGQFDPTDVLCIAEELHCITGKQVDVYAACEINAESAFYDAILEEGVQIA